MSVLRKTFAPLIVVIMINGVNTQMTGGAIPAELGQFKHIVALWYNEAHTCGGALITEQHVLTAGHCLYQRDATKFRIYAGIVNMRTRPQATRSGKQIYVHKNYAEPIRTKKGIFFTDFTRPLNDIGILVVNSPISLEENVDKIALPEKDVNTCSLCTVAGWGRTIEDNPTLSTILLWGRTTPLSQQRCKEFRVNFVPDREFCAIDEDKLARPNQGDSGGPLVCKEQVMGIVVGGPDDVKLPEIYTNVYYYMDFITDVLKVKSSSSGGEL